MSAVIHALLTVTSEPVEILKKDGPPVCTVTAREADDHQGKRQVFQLFGLSEKSRRTISGLGPGDAVSVVGPIAVRVEAGGAVIQVNAVDCSMQLPITPKPKPKKPKAPRPKTPRQSGHRGTRKATASGVAAANLAFARKHGA